MARPKPTVVLEQIDRKTYRAEQVLAASAIYAVFYQGRPINLRSLNTLVSYPGPKYKKTAFPNSGPAFNLADRLNDLFKTTDFAVVMLTHGTVMQEDADS